MGRERGGGGREKGASVFSDQYLNDSGRALYMCKVRYESPACSTPAVAR